ncbi:hypothetical protein D0Z67_02000 [Streptomyces seoulensis]|uniref:Uncharacterized protein n=1 Tax=Streptomyces seoulensis TaxID=73044 RepID=A0A4P6TPJ1_STRSO|nr:hypothetical protein [Streptomyces seoulensis]QBJ89205.1 hypothetical protein D0Z67_02000 [Streptomyces seoulensis]
MTRSTPRTVLISGASIAGPALAYWVGAYVLAGELATRADHTEAFTAYERITRDFVEANQALATAGGTFITPTTREMLDARNAALQDAAALNGEEGRAAHAGLVLPDYAG